MEISSRLAAHALGVQFPDLPSGTVAVVKSSLLDALGTTLAGFALGQCSGAFLELARASGSGPCRIIGQPLTAAPAVAALVNASVAHALDYEDTHDAGLVHPTATALPAALAVAQLRGDVTGPEFITAIAVGSDITCRLGMAMGDDDTPRGWVMRPLLGTYGATAAAGRLLGLNAGQLVEAFGLAFSQATCSKGFFGYAPSHLREIRDGFAAQAAVTSALLARGGVRSQDQPIEGPHGLFAMYAGGRFDAERLLRDLGRVFECTHLSFKPWPSCRGTHPHVEAALELMRMHAIEPDRIARVHASVSATFGMLCSPPDQKRRPATANDARFSIPFCTAAALVRGRLTLAEFTPPALVDPRILALADRVECEVRNEGGLDDALRGSLRLVMTDGRKYRHAVECPLGAPGRPLQPQELLAKFLDCASFAAPPWDAGRARAVAERIDTLDRAADLSALSI